MMTKVNSAGNTDGEVALWLNNQLVGDYAQGSPVGTWLRDSFNTWGPYDGPMTAIGSNGQKFSTGPAPFGGFSFATSSSVLMKSVTLGSYWQSDDPQLANSPSAETILYDNIVLATQRIGCLVKP